MTNFVKYYWFVLALLGLVVVRSILYCHGVPLCLFRRTFVRSSGTGNTYIDAFRKRSQEIVYATLPEPQAQLVLGMVMGINDLKRVPWFNDILKQTGTMHVVVVSGYNINLVFNLILGVLGSRYKLKNMMIAQGICFVYGAVSGMGPPVIRALIMGSVLSWVKYTGGGVDALRVTLAAALLMILYKPTNISDLSFVLTFLATLSLVLCSQIFEPISSRFTGFIGGLIGDGFTTISAQVLVWPLISMMFGTVSLISPLANGVVLWTVPISTILGSLLIGAGLISIDLAKLFSFILILPLNFFVTSLQFFSKIPNASVMWRLDITTSLLYYVGIAIFLIYRDFKSKKISIYIF